MKAPNPNIYYFRRKDTFGLFLVYCVQMSFLLYTIANKNMPWLLVNITLPMIVLSGKFLKDIFLRYEFRHFAGIFLLAGMTVLFVWTPAGTQIKRVSYILISLWNYSFTRSIILNCCLSSSAALPARGLPES